MIVAIGLCGAAFLFGESKVEVPKSVIAGNTAFALEMHRRLGDKPGNVFFSPSSMSMALAMAASGADGKTLEEIAATLRQSKNSEERDAGMAALSAFGSAQAPGFKLVAANSLWGQHDYPFLPGYVQRLRQSYRAEATTLDFRDRAGAAKTVNDWVEQATAGKITGLLAPDVVTPQTKLVLVNAVYFLGEWRTPFDKQATFKEPFQIDEATKVSIDMMHKTDAYRYAENDDWQCLAMTYKPANIRGEMVVLLPRSGKESTKLESTLSLESLDRLLGGLRPQRVAVTMPKLKLQTKYDLKTPLRNMGMNLAFDAIDADFRGISSGEGLYITDVVHQAFLEMNEERTEAAAATGVVMAPRGLPAKTDRPVVFKADRPFLFLIRDARTGLIFFLGRFADPRQSS